MSRLARTRPARDVRRSLSAMRRASQAGQVDTRGRAPPSRWTRRPGPGNAPSARSTRAQARSDRKRSLLAQTVRAARATPDARATSRPRSGVEHGARNSEQAIHVASGQRLGAHEFGQRFEHRVEALWLLKDGLERRLTDTSSALAKRARVSICGARSPRSIIERKETEISALSASPSWVTLSVRDCRSWRIRRPRALVISTPSCLTVESIMPRECGLFSRASRVPRVQGRLNMPNPTGSQETGCENGEQLGPMRPRVQN